MLLLNFNRDLKPENIMFAEQDKMLKVIDFGCSAKFNPDKKLKDNIGTCYYIAPEVLTNSYNEKCDIWSCGVILYILLTGQPPFNGDNDKQILEEVKKGTLNFQETEWETLSSQAKELVSKMVERNVEKRVSAEEALNDPWFKMWEDEKQKDNTITEQKLQHLRSFRNQQKLQNACWAYLVNFFIRKEEMLEIAESFK